MQTIIEFRNTQNNIYIYISQKNLTNEIWNCKTNCSSNKLKALILRKDALGYVSIEHMHMWSKTQIHDYQSNITHKTELRQLTSSSETTNASY